MHSRYQYHKIWKEKNRTRLNELARLRNSTPEAKLRLLNNQKRYRLKPGVKEKESAAQILYRARLKEKIFTHYGSECSCCKESNLYFLSVDHVNNDGNLDKRGFRKKRPGGRELYGRIIREGFPDKYQILCMNCNFGKHKNGGICPHKNIKEIQNG